MLTLITLSSAVRTVLSTVPVDTELKQEYSISMMDIRVRDGKKARGDDANCFLFANILGPVTAVDFHAASSTGVDLSHLYLSASFDWTFKLWSMREQKPLYSFEDGSDYLYDVRWSPIHPALFATVDGLGRLDIWNLNHDTELPTVSTVVEGMSALNRLIWSPNGQQLVVGDDAGRIAVYDVGEVSTLNLRIFYVVS